jgi:hypothetical protein
MSIFDGSSLPEVELSLDVVDGSSAGAWRPVHVHSHETLSRPYECSVVLASTNLEANVDEEGEDEIEIEGSFDVLVKGTVKAEKRGEIAGSEVVETTLTLKLINGKTRKVVRTLTGSEKGSRGSVKAAASTSAFKICQKKVPEMVADIEKYFAR